jgi:hypothetical protein
VKWEDGLVDEHGFSDAREEIKAGTLLYRDTRRGRFGARWVVRDATVISAEEKLPE